MFWNPLINHSTLGTESVQYSSKNKTKDISDKYIEICLEHIHIDT